MVKKLLTSAASRSSISRKPGNGVFNLASVEHVADIKPCEMQNLNVQNNKETKKQKSNQTQHQQSG